MLFGSSLPRIIGVVASTTQSLAVDSQAVISTIPLLTPESEADVGCEFFKLRLGSRLAEASVGVRTLIKLKSVQEIEAMRPAGRLVAEAHRLIKGMIQPGIRTIDIDRAVEELFESRGAEPLFKGYPGRVPYPAVTCISVNDEVVHGIPGDRELQTGDIVSVDTGCRLQGWCGDSAWTYPVGKVDNERLRLLEIGEANLYLAIQELGHCRRWSEVARQMQNAVDAAGFTAVESFVGHGIGREMHEDPQVPAYINSQVLKEDFELRPGLVLAVEPMVNAGSKHVYICRRDHWTVRTRDGKSSVHFEHTVALTEEGPIVLTAV